MRVYDWKIVLDSIGIWGKVEVIKMSLLRSWHKCHLGAYETIKFFCITSLFILQQTIPVPLSSSSGLEKKQIYTLKFSYALIGIQKHLYLVPRLTNCCGMDAFTCVVPLLCQSWNARRLQKHLSLCDTDPFEPQSFANRRVSWLEALMVGMLF